MHRAHCPRCGVYLFHYVNAATVQIVYPCQRCGVYAWFRADAGLLVAEKVTAIRRDANRRRLPPSEADPAVAP